MDGNRKDHAPVIRTPTEEQERQLAAYDQRMAALEARLREPWPEIDRRQAEWERQLLTAEQGVGAAAAAQADAAAEVALGDWHTVGPFAENRRYLFRKTHGPEGKPVDLSQQFELATGEKVNWTRRPEWLDGQPHSGLPGEIAANFLYRSITAGEAQKVSASFGSDDAIKVFLNGKQLLANDAERAVAADQDVIELPLAAGENHLLVKIMNYGGDSGFYFALKSDSVGLPAEIRRIVNTAPPQRDAAQEAGCEITFATALTNPSSCSRCERNLPRFVRTAPSSIGRCRRR